IGKAAGRGKGEDPGVPPALKKKSMAVSDAVSERWPSSRRQPPVGAPLSIARHVRGRCAWRPWEQPPRRALASFFFSSRRRHTRLVSDWSSDVCSSDLYHLDDENVTARTVFVDTGSM